MLDGGKVDGLDGDGGGDSERPSTLEDNQRQEEGELLRGSMSASNSDVEGGSSVDSDGTSDKEFSLDMDVVDDVTNDEGFELGEVSLHLDAGYPREDPRQIQMHSDREKGYALV